MLRRRTVGDKVVARGTSYQFILPPPDGTGSGRPSGSRPRNWKCMQRKRGSRGRGVTRVALPLPQNLPKRPRISIISRQTTHGVSIPKVHGSLSLSPPSHRW